MTAADRPRRPRRFRWARWLAAVLLSLVAIVVVAALWLRSRLFASLPQESGEAVVGGLTAPVTVERDALGVPSIHAANRLDAAAALGFLHGQERFFQMDLLRRMAAGELSEIVGPAALPLDRDHRLHRCRTVAEASWRRAGAAERALVEAYTRGVNAGLSALRAAPPEYLALRAAPAPWQPADCYLAVLGMFFNLNDSHAHEQATRAALAARLSPQLLEFVAPVGTEWDAPLLGDAIPTPPVPGPEVIDLRHSQPATPKTATAAGAAGSGGPASAGRTQRTAALSAAPQPTGMVDRLAGIERNDRDDRDDRNDRDDFSAMTGSNNFAVAAGHTADGHAWVANDMHLGLALPNTWYRAALRWQSAGAAHASGTSSDSAGGQVTGVTLPGTPGVAVGSNGQVAWAFTNSYGDYADLIDLEPVPGDPDAYRTPAGPRRFEHVHERIHVHGRADQDIEILETVWGPVLPPDPAASAPASWPRRAVIWTAHFPEAVNLAAFTLEGARTLDEAVEAAHHAGIPPQNFTVADSSGRIGWTIIGQIPRRIGFDGRVPTSWADGSHRWDGWLTSGEVPALLDPPSGRIWTANARAVGGEMLARLGNAGFDLGARARQIRDDLLSLDRATPRDLLAIQLDDRALYLSRWRDLLLAALTPAAVANDARRAELRRVVAGNWTGHASVDSAAYRLVRAFRGRLEEQVFGNLVGLDREPSFRPPGAPRPGKQFEGPLWRVLTERPAHLLDPRYADWDDEILFAADAMLLQSGPILAAEHPGETAVPLSRFTWGTRNTLAARHPLSAALPFLSRWLDLPPHQLPGDRDMPRVQGPAMGASERIVVSPGREEQGFFEMPGGQSGHPLSPHYRDGEAAWEHGDPTPFLPGAAVTALRLVPAPH